MFGCHILFKNFMTGGINGKSSGNVNKHLKYPPFMKKNNLLNIKKHVQKYNSKSIILV